MRASVIVTSDSCAEKPEQDTSGEYVRDHLEQSKIFDSITKFIVADELSEIKSIVASELKNQESALIITVGGTGLCPRDVTPEATSSFYDRYCYGIQHALLNHSLKCSPYAALSRLTSGVSGQCLIVNLPGKLKACQELMPVLDGLLKHALEQIRFAPESYTKTHLEMKKLQVLDKPDALPLPVPKSDQLQQSKRNMMLDFNMALSLIQFNACNLTLDTQNVSLIDETQGSLILSRRHKSLVQVPPYSVSMVDGYVVSTRNEWTDNINLGGSFRASIVDAGDFFTTPYDLISDTLRRKVKTICYKVNTGEKVPELGGFLVVPVEDAKPVRHKFVDLTVRLRSEESLSDPSLLHVRKVGSDLSTKSYIEKGASIGPAETGVLLSMGYKSVEVFKIPHIAILSTGDELLEAEQDIKPVDINDIIAREKEYLLTEVGPSSVIDVNGPILSKLLKKSGYSTKLFGPIADVSCTVRDTIADILQHYDVLVVTGGASMGDKDHVKPVLESLGAQFYFHKLNIKPGKPAGFAALKIDDRNKFVFTLPGNPVSAYITTVLLVIPFMKSVINYNIGLGRPSMIVNNLTLDSIGFMVTVVVSELIGEPYTFDGRLEFVRAKRFASSGTGDATIPVSIDLNQQSSRLMSLLNCYCLIMIDPNLKGSKFQVGQTYPALRLEI